MTIGSVFLSRGRMFGWSLFLFCVPALFIGATLADEETDNANNMLENLKRRSAEERWQRVKKLYPSDPPSPNRKIPSQLPDDRQSSLPEGEIPPSPEQAQLIPRLSAMPIDVSNDWVRPARQPVVEESLLDVVPSPSSSDVSNSTEGQSATKGTKIVAQNVDPNTPTVDKITNDGAMHARYRKISDIDPYYDRTKDSDIRQFAIEKAKEFDILFTPRTYEERSFPPVTLAWEASNFYFYPLYFSDPALERYGHAHHPLIQPFASIARVGVQFVFLPYQATILQPLKPESPLGYYRPGDCAPKLHYQFPLNAEAALVEAGVITGLHFIITP